MNSEKSSWKRWILWCATPRSFLQKSIPFDIWRNVDEKSKKHYDFKSSAEHFLFKLLSFCNEWSYWYQIGLKLKLIFSSFKKCKEGNFSLMVYHIWLEKNWSFDENLDQELSHSSEIDSKHQLNILSQVFPKTTSK